MNKLYKWEDAINESECTLQEAIKVLDAAALRIVLILDINKKLLGTLTDGDVRRALLNNYPLNTPVKELMNKNPKKAECTWSQSHILSIMNKYKLLQLPIINEQGQVVSLFTLPQILEKQSFDNPVFLMAGGFGKRLLPLTENVPKPMLKLNGKPIMERIILNFIESGFSRFFISTHYKPKAIYDYFGNGEKWGIDIDYIYEEKPLGTGGALGLLPHSEINTSLIMINGDVMTSTNFSSLIDFHNTNNAEATICVREYEHQVPYGVITNEGIKIKKIIEKPIHNFFINAGVYVLSPEFIRGVKKNYKVDMPNLLQNIINKGQRVNMFPIHEQWIDIGRLDDYKRANNYKMN